MLYVTVVEMPAETGFEMLLAWFGQIPRVITNTVVQIHSLMPDSLLFARHDFNHMDLRLDGSNFLSKNTDRSLSTR